MNEKDVEFDFEEDLVFSEEKYIEEGKEKARLEKPQHSNEEEERCRGFEDSFKVFKELGEFLTMLDQILEVEKGDQEDFKIFKKKKYHTQAILLQKELKELILLTNPNNIGDSEFKSNHLENTFLKVRILFTNIGILRKMKFSSFENKNDDSILDF